MSLKTLLFPPKSVQFFKRIDVPVITAGSIVLYDRETALKAYRRFSPFINFHIVNDSQVSLDVTFDYNPNRRIKILSGGTGDSKNQPFETFTIKNLDSSLSTAANEVFLQIETIT